MHNSEDVATVRSRLVKMPGVSAVSVDLRKMQAQITSAKIIGALALRNALGNADFGLTGLTTSLIAGPFSVRDDEIDEQIPPI
jgi:copper chaperone CopZ